MKKRIILSVVCVLVLVAAVFGVEFYRGVMGDYDNMMAQFNDYLISEEQYAAEQQVYFEYKDTLPSNQEEWSQDQSIEHGRTRFALSQLQGIWQSKMNDYNVAVSQLPGHISFIGNHVRGTMLPKVIIIDSSNA